MQSDMSQMSLSELKKLKTSVAKEIDKRGNQSKQAILKQVKKLCSEHGLEMGELFPAKEAKPLQAKKQTKSTKPKKTIEPVYFHQADPSKTWTGRGRKPEWIVTWVENGGNLEDLKKRPW